MARRAQDHETRQPDLQSSECAAAKARVDRVREYLEREVWPRIPPDVLGKPISKEELEEILGYGPEGV